MMLLLAYLVDLPGEVIMKALVALATASLILSVANLALGIKQDNPVILIAAGSFEGAAIGLYVAAFMSRGNNS
jgi:hypothetical protein